MPRVPAGSLVAASMTTLLVVCTAPMSIAAVPEGYAISPGRFVLPAAPGRGADLRLDPITFSNRTSSAVVARPSAIGLRQLRDGTVTVDASPAARRRAAELLVLTGRQGIVPAGATASTRTTVRRPGPGRGVYAAVLYEARPAASADARPAAQTTYGLAARVIIDGADPERALNAEDPAGTLVGRRLRTVAPVRNVGTSRERVSGTMTVSRRGVVLARVRLSPQTLLPGAIVDLTPRRPLSLPSAPPRVRVTATTWGADGRRHTRTALVDARASGAAAATPPRSSTSGAPRVAPPIAAKSGQGSLRSIVLVLAAALAGAALATAGGRLRRRRNR